jgi:cardiolipin synthase
LIYVLLFYLGKYYYIYIFFEILATILAFYILGASINPEYKLAWVMIVLIFPIFSIFTYLIFKKKNNIITVKNEFIQNTINDSMFNFTQNDFCIKDEFVKNISNYIFNTSKFQIYKSNEIIYLESGEIFFESLLRELKNAKKFIFMEYFIIEEGKIWNSILEILEKKVKEGIDVRLIYDDLGSLFSLESDYAIYLEKKGIKTFVFNKLKPFFEVKINNRSHRKLTVIDGIVGFIGGCNLADEYTNIKNKYGHWKDNGIMFRGESVNNLTIMFLQFWAMKINFLESYEKFLNSEKNTSNYETDDMIQVFSDSPFDNENVYKNVYLKILYNAKKYVYINTPYLIINNELKVAFLSAVKAGVDVRITIPHIPDKKIVFAMTKLFARNLVEGGVKIYEYTPGFLHAKSFVSDDKYSIIGSANLDSRSLYLDFECGAFIYSEKLATNLKKDYLKTLELSEELSLDKMKTNKIIQFYKNILRLFTPIM